jgi:uncharacterized protein
MLPDAIRASLNGVVPSQMATVSKDGWPNQTIISQVFYVDPEHVAISHQFFSKSSKNIAENPRAHVQVMDPADCAPWFLELEFARIETSGDLFENMEMQLEAIASMTGMSDIFKLQAAYVFRVLSVRKGSETQRSA